jgi:hypothetical protein
MDQEKNITKKNGVSGEKFSSDQLQAALVEVWDLFDRAMCPFMAFREIARQMSQRQIPHDLSVLEFGVKSEHITPEVASVFKTFAKDVAVRLGKDGQPIAIRFFANKVPVVITVVKRNYPVLDHPDTVTHLIEDFKIPNPFDKYWKMRFFIR